MNIVISLSIGDFFDTGGRGETASYCPNNHIQHK